MFWKLRYGLAALSYKRKDDKSVSFEARVNPSQEFMQGLMPRGEPLRLLIHDVVQEDLMKHPDVQETAKWMGTAMPDKPGATGDDATRVDVPGGVGFPALTVRMREQLEGARAAGKKKGGQGRWFWPTAEQGVWEWQQIPDEQQRVHHVRQGRRHLPGACRADRAHERRFRPAELRRRNRGTSP